MLLKTENPTFAKASVGRQERSVLYVREHLERRFSAAGDHRLNRYYRLSKSFKNASIFPFF